MFVAALPLTALAIYVHTTRRGKFLVWAEIIDSLRLPGDQRVLDVGCGCSVEEISINRAFLRAACKSRPVPYCLI